MPKAIFRFYEELNDFLPREKRKVDFEESFQRGMTVREFVRILGVPHRKIDLILVNGESAEFDYTLMDGDRISLYPVFERFDIERVTKLADRPLRRTRFIVDSDLADVADYMRALGMDVYYDPALSTAEIIRRSKDENRIVLSRNKKLLESEALTHGILLQSGSIRDQVKGVLKSLNIELKRNSERSG